MMLDVPIFKKTFSMIVVKSKLRVCHQINFWSLFWVGGGVLSKLPLQPHYQGGIKHNYIFLVSMVTWELSLEVHLLQSIQCLGVDLKYEMAFCRCINLIFNWNHIDKCVIKGKFFSPVA